MPNRGTAWIVTERMHVDLHAALHVPGRKIPFSPHDKLEATKHIARALSYLHEMGVHHRDLKPANIMKAQGSSVWKLIDFGLATIRKRSDPTLVGGAMQGSPGYMAPE